MSKFGIVVLTIIEHVRKSKQVVLHAIRGQNKLSS